ncbi:MAG: hypothetical protein QOF81_1310 [Acidimicrobiaceae bacterium]|nr:hypothetical protein [Acidimicrobiaceae bacterium]
MVTAATMISSALGASSSAAVARPVDRPTQGVVAGFRLAADAPSAFAREIVPPSSTAATTAAATTAAPTTAAPTTAAPTTAAAATTASAGSSATPAPPGAPAGNAPSASDFSRIGYRWNPCRVITVESTGPNVADVVAELVSITGLHLQMVTGAADITVAWGSVPGAGNLADTVWRAGGGWLIHASVTVDRNGQPFLATLVRHELAHALGLRHAASANEIMYRTAGPDSPTDYQAGDLAGLRAVGASGGCGGR